MGECVFCMIVSGDIESRRVFENDSVIAFDDIAPQAPVHTLVVPRRHLESMDDADFPEVAAALFSAVAEVARAKGLAERGYRVIVNNGRDANQTVGHLHVHVMGGRAMSHGMVRFDES